MSIARETQSAEEAGATLVDILIHLNQELHPRRALTIPLTLDTRLEEDIGFDSLVRVEYLSRVQRAFNVKLPESLLGAMETPRDVLIALLDTHLASPVTIGQAARLNVDESLAMPPIRTATFIDVFAWHMRAHPSRTHLVFEDQHESAHVMTYAALWEKAVAVAAALHERGMEPGQTVALMLPTGLEYFYSFFGIILMGGVPVPIYPPVRPAQLKDHFRRHAGILANAEVTFFIVPQQAKTLARLLSVRVDTLKQVISPIDLIGSGKTTTPYAAKGEDLALLQYTSGSTGDPKGVMLSHSNLLASVRAMGEAIRVTPKDVIVSWLPLYHDMGLIGSWLGSLYHGCPLIVMSPMSFLARPERWLKTIHRHGGTLSGGPNFAYDFCLQKIQDDDIADLDLSTWRWAFNGAEQVNADTMRLFAERFRRYGFRGEAVAPVYGLAENALGVAFPPLNQGLRVDRIKRDVFMNTHHAEPTTDDDTTALSFVSCGHPLPRHDVRIVDGARHELGEREEGHLEFKGPSATRGYYRRPKESERLVRDGWLDSEDLAYIANGDLYITGRTKDIVIRRGRNIYPYEIEEAVGDIAGIRRGCVAVFGSRDTTAATEKLIVLAETRETDSIKRERIRLAINSKVVDLLGEPPDDIVLAPIHTVLKTSSGKIRHRATRERYEKGYSAKGSRSLWRQTLFLVLADVGPIVRRFLRKIGQSVYAAYVWTCFALCVLAGWIAIVLSPRTSWAWKTGSLMARVFFYVAGSPITVKGNENLPYSTCVLVANHASYLDGVVLAAALQRPFNFVAKHELNNQFFVGTLLRGIGTQFVERFDPEQGAEAVERLTALVKTGHSLVLFPEGRLNRRAGLQAFHLGAFAVAAQADVPMVPVTIIGTRTALRNDEWFPHHQRIEVLIDTPMMPEGKEWTAVIRLRDAVRQQIARQCGEPDIME